MIGNTIFFSILKREREYSKDTLNLILWNSTISSNSKTFVALGTSADDTNPINTRYPVS